jgi:tetratricopeptide (TPR) repeat protein
MMLALLLAASFAQEEPAFDDPWSAWSADRPTTARRLAEERLTVDPSDLQARLVLGAVLFEHEGDLPRAQLHLMEVVRRFEAAPDFGDSDAWRTHAIALLLLGHLAGAMDDREAQLDWLDAHDRQYQPPALAERAWALMKLGRHPEALEMVDRVLAEGDPEDAAVVRTARCAILSERGDRRGADAACGEALEHADGGDLAVEAHNAAGAAEAALRLGDALAILRRGLAGGAGNVSNPWQGIVAIHARAGRGAEAAQAVEQMQAWRLEQRPSLRDQTRASLDRTFAVVLWVGGHADRALALVDRARDLPDRNGFSSATSARDGLHLALLRLAVAADARARALEDAAALPLPGRLWARARAWAGGLSDVWDRAVARDLAGASWDVVSLFRPYRMDGLGAVEPWWAGEVIDALGAGVVAAAVEQAVEPEMPETAPWLDALRAELAWRAGRWETADELVDRALAGLPPEEGALRTRLLTIRAAIAYGSGRGVDGYAEVLRRDPGALRRLDLALPVRIEGAGPLADALRRSPRFEEDPSGIRVQVEGGRACLVLPGGGGPGCSRPGADVVDATRFVHLDLLSLRTGLDDAAIDRLDGLAALVDERVRARRDDDLRRMMREDVTVRPQPPR